MRSPGAVVLLAVTLALGCGGTGGDGGTAVNPPAKGPVDVLVVSTAGCLNTPRTMTTVAEAAKELGAAIRVRTVVVSTQEEARRYRFHGSPTVLVNGLDLDPAMRGNGAYGFT